MSKKHDVVAIVVDDPAERKLPSVGLVDLRDAETDEIVTVDTSSQYFRDAFEREMKKRFETRERDIRGTIDDRSSRVSQKCIVGAGGISACCDEDTLQVALKQIFRQSGSTALHNHSGATITRKVTV